MDMLERDREFSEDKFDYVQQLVRTIAMRCESSHRRVGTCGQLLALPETQD